MEKKKRSPFEENGYFISRECLSNISYMLGPNKFSISALAFFLEFCAELNVLKILKIESIKERKVRVLIEILIY